MTKFVKYLLISLVISYSFGAWYEWGINPADWEKRLRADLFVLALGLSLGFWVAIFIWKDINRDD